jgi:hypothetical protein
VFIAASTLNFVAAFMALLVLKPMRARLTGASETAPVRPPAFAGGART